MPELVLLTLVKREFHKLYQRARQGDELALAELDAMWDGYKDQTLACFLCDSEVPYPVRVIMLPEYGDQRNIVAAPLGTRCADLPQGTKLHRSIKVLRQMNQHKAPGKQIHYDFAPVHRH
jgi:hypothetical protein